MNTTWGSGIKHRLSSCHSSDFLLLCHHFRVDLVCDHNYGGDTPGVARHETESLACVYNNDCYLPVGSCLGLYVNCHPLLSDYSVLSAVLRRSMIMARQLNRYLRALSVSCHLVVVCLTGGQQVWLALDMQHPTNGPACINPPPTPANRVTTHPPPAIVTGRHKSNLIRSLVAGRLQYPTEAAKQGVSGSFRSQSFGAQLVLASSLSLPLMWSDQVYAMMCVWHSPRCELGLPCAFGKIMLPWFGHRM